MAMHVIKRGGRKEPVNFDKVLHRIQELSYGLSSHINPEEIAQKTIEGIFDGVTTTELDNLAARISATLTVKHHDYAILAARIAISNIHKNTEKNFSNLVEQLYSAVNPHTGEKEKRISKKFYETVKENADKLDSAIVHSRDYQTLDYFGIKTLENSYLMKIKGRVVERPQCMFMRSALAIHLDDIDSAIETYNLMSKKYFTHATPTLFNAGMERQQMSSCFLMQMQDDSIKGIYKTLERCAIISKYSGGIGVSVHNIRSRGSGISGTGGTSSGLIPMLKNFNETAKYVNQGGKRNGSIAVYLEPWHSDIEDFLELKRNDGDENLRARDLFYALWIPDLFMKRVEADEDWSLFCPNEAKGLSEAYGGDFDKLYHSFESKGLARKTLKARDLWFRILEAQIETGTPYVLYKDAANRKSNQKNLGTIKSSNLCTEIVEYTAPNEIAVCNLASIALNNYINSDGKFDFKQLHRVAKIVTKNLNKVIDVNFYPLEEARESNMKHRPIGIGVQGLADTFAILKLPFDSVGAKKLNKEIFETIYHGAIEASMELAQKDGPYETYKGSPISEGKFQFDLWGVIPDSGLWNWEVLRDKVKKYGVRNSLLLAPMPTASTAQIFGNNESIEPFTSNLYVRRVQSGDFVVVNKYLLKELNDISMWNDSLRKKLISENGSIQNIKEIPEDIKNRFKTVWEISQKEIIDMSADRGAFICQSQSLNIHMEDANIQKLTSMHFYAWKRGLKTGMYYLRNTPSRNAVQFTVKQNLKARAESTSKETVSQPKSKDDPNICLSCGS